MGSLFYLAPLALHLELETIVEDTVNNIETTTAIHSRSSNVELVENYDSNNGRKLKYFVIEKFPSEFKKNIFKSVDLRFLTILFFSLIIHIITLYILESKFPALTDSKAITEVQQQYVKMLLDDDFTSYSSDRFMDSRSEVEPLDAENINRLSKWMDEFTENELEALNDMPGSNAALAELVEPPMLETKIPPKDAINNAHKNAAIVRRQTLSELEKKVSSIGLLGLIGGKTRLRDHEYVEDLLEYADLNADHFASVLSGLSSIQVPRHNTAGYILSYKRNADIQGGKLKGGRSTAQNDNLAAIRNMVPLEKAKTTKTERATDYEEVPTEDPITKLQSQPIAGKKREPMEVVRVVQSHKKALQDCYKQELKINPSVRGKIVVRFTIDPNGNVVSASAVSSTLNSSMMENCIINRIKNWKDFGSCDPAFGSVTYKQVFNFGGSD